MPPSGENWIRSGAEGLNRERPRAKRPVDQHRWLRVAESQPQIVRGVKTEEWKRAAPPDH